MHELLLQFILEMGRNGCLVSFEVNNVPGGQVFVIRISWHQNGNRQCVMDTVEMNKLHEAPMDMRINYWRQLYQHRVITQKGCHTNG